MSVTLRWKTYPSGIQSAYLDINQDGTRKKKFLGIKLEKKDTQRKKKKELAQAIRDQTALAIKNKEYGFISEEKANADFLKYFQLFIDNYKKAGIRKYKYSFQKFKDYLKQDSAIKAIPFKKLDHKICQSYYDYLHSKESGLNGETPEDYFKRFSSVINTAVKSKFLRSNPCREIQRKKIVKSQVKKNVLTESELQLLANSDCPNKEVKRAFLFACFTGLGQKEIRSLKWKDVVNGMINTHRAKSGEPVINKLPQTAIQLLGDIGPSEAFIFNLPSDVAIGKNLNTWTDKASIERHISFYCGRHTFAVMLLQNGANLKTVADALAHTDTKHTVKYLNYVNALKDKAMDSLVELKL